jgi:hypothetical protein
MQQTLRLLLFALVAATLAVATGAGQKKRGTGSATPVLLQNSLEAVSVGQVIELVTYHPDGLPDQPPDIRFIFIQDEKRITARYMNGCGDELAATESLSVTLPEGLSPGTCKVVAQVGQTESQPIELEITSSVKAPVVTGEYPQVTSVPQYPPRPAQSGDIVYIDGANFSPSDVVEIVDARGTIHRLPAGASAGSTGFTVPENIADGQATFEIIEQRSGLQQRSNKVPIQILNVPLPLEIVWDGLRPIGSGQWIDIGHEDVPPYGQPQNVEIGFFQNNTTAIVKFFLQLNADLHIQIPKTLFPGEAVVRTRTVRDGRVSEWSEPARLEVLEHPAPASVLSIQRIKKGTLDRTAPFVNLDGDQIRALDVDSGDKIAVWGHFGTESTRSVRVKLVRGKKQLVIKPTDSDPPLPCYFEFDLPGKLQTGDWEVYVFEDIFKTSTKLKLTLRVR